MSPSVGNFVADLVEMAKATEELPHAQAEIDRLRGQLDEAQRHIQGLETNIQGYKGDIDGLQERNRKLEVDRDDAEYRFLELDEKFRSLAGLVASAGKAVGLVDKPEPVVEQPKVEPVATSNYHPEQVDDPHLPQGQSEAHPSEPSQSVGTGHVDTPTPASSPDTASTQPEPHPQLQPEASASATPDPTASSTAGDGHSSDTATPTPAQQGADASLHSEVSYATEPSAKWSHEWYQWRDQMDAKYGYGNWPNRHQSAAS